MSQQLSQRLRYIRAVTPKHVKLAHANEVYMSWAGVLDMAMYNGTTVCAEYFSYFCSLSLIS